MNCENCVYYDEDRDNQPCCSCHGQNFEEIDNKIGFGHDVIDIFDILDELKKKYIKDCTTCKHLVSCEPNTSGKFDCWEKDE